MREIETRYAEYMPAKSNQLLHEMGLKKGPDGFRTLPDGKPLEITVETIETSGAVFDAIELSRKGWENVGLKVVVKSSERSVFWTRALGNQVQIAEWATDRGLQPFVD